MNRISTSNNQERDWYAVKQTNQTKSNQTRKQKCLSDKYFMIYFDTGFMIVSYF